MESLLLYLLKSSLCISIFLGIYWLFLKNETFHKFKRSYLLFGMLLSLIIPLIRLSYQVVLPFIPGSQTRLEQKLVIDDSLPIVLNYFIPGLYLLGLVLVLIYQMLGLFKIRRLLQASQFKSLEGCKVLQTDIYKTSFSVFSFIFLDTSENSSKKEQQLILQHEIAHVKQHHWADLLFANILCAVQWFNPFSWIYLRCIKQNHEFLADEQVLIKGYSGAEYRAVLINQSLKFSVFEFSSAFANNSQILRMTMMLKNPSAPFKRYFTIFSVPLLLLLIFAFAKRDYVMENRQHLNASAKEIVFPAKTTKPFELLNQNPITKNSSTAVRKLQTKLSYTKKHKSFKLITASEEETYIPLPVTTSNAPIYIIDGVETDPIDDLLPENVLSINILKGLKAVEMYGPKAVNGIIIVTTNR